MSLSHNPRSHHPEQPLPLRNQGQHQSRTTHSNRLDSNNGQRNARYQYQVRCKKRLLRTMPSDVVSDTLEDVSITSDLDLVDALRSSGGRVERQSSPASLFKEARPTEEQSNLTTPYQFPPSSESLRTEPHTRQGAKRLTSAKERPCNLRNERQQPFQPGSPSSLCVFASSPTGAVLNPLRGPDQAGAERLLLQHGGTITEKLHSKRAPKVGVSTQERTTGQDGAQSLRAQDVKFVPVEMTWTHAASTKHRPAGVDVLKFKDYPRWPDKLKLDDGANRWVSKRAGKATSSACAKEIESATSSREKLAQTNRIAIYEEQDQPIERTQTPSPHQRSTVGTLKIQSRGDSLYKRLYKPKPRHYTGVSAFQRCTRKTTGARNFFYYLRNGLSEKPLHKITATLVAGSADAVDAPWPHSPNLLFPGGWPEVIAHESSRGRSRPPPTSPGPHFPGAWPGVPEQLVL